MTTPTNPIEPFSPFLPAFVNIPTEEERVRTFLQEKLSAHADVINDKKIGAYTQQAESFNGEKWVYDTTKKVRNGYQTLARIPQYPNAGTITLSLPNVPVTPTNFQTYPLTDVNPQFVISLTYGTASRPCSAVGVGDGDYFTFMNRGDPRVTFDMSNILITITTTIDLTKYSGFIVIHYIRDGDDEP